jgi:hypothetical protein
MSEVTAPAEEPAEQVEGVVATASSAAPLFVLLEALVPVLVVDAARFGVAEGFIGFCHRDEFIVCGFIVGIFVWMVLLAEAAVCLFDFAIGGFTIKAQELYEVSNWKTLEL